jgi:hypothetical protein
MSDEEAFFEVWFQLERRKSWERSRIPSDPKDPPKLWSMGLRTWMLEGWMARASLHVTQADTEGKQ